VKAIDFMNERIDKGYCPHSQEVVGSKRRRFPCFFIAHHLEGIGETHPAFNERCTLEDMKRCHFTSPVDFDRIKGGS